MGRSGEFPVLLIIFFFLILSQEDVTAIQFGDILVLTTFAWKYENILSYTRASETDLNIFFELHCKQNLTLSSQSSTL